MSSKAVMIKSYQNGITIVMKEEVPFEEVLSQIGEKFSQSKSFFQDSKIALSLEGRTLDKKQELLVLETIEQNSDVEVVCIVGKDEETEKLFVRALKHTKKRLEKDRDGQFFRGDLKGHEKLETENSIVILGNVEPGCSVVSAKDIIVLGGLYGTAYAGADGTGEHYVAALEMEPQAVTVGDFKYKSTGKQKKWGFRSKTQPKIAYVKNGKIVLEPLSKELLELF